jgi:hypothetical protein
MINLWVYKVEHNIMGTTVEDVPMRYRKQVEDIINSK